jgi:hypothetical protein
MSNTNLEFTIINDSVWLSLTDFRKLLLRWKREGAKIRPEPTAIKKSKKKVSPQ